MNPFSTATVPVPTFLAQVRQPMTLVGRRPAPNLESQSFLLPSVLCGLCVAALSVIVVRARRKKAGVRGRRALVLVARSLGLSASERALIETIGAPEPAAALLSEHAFRAAVERWTQSDPSESGRKTLLSLATRLGWTLPELSPVGAAVKEPRPLVHVTTRSKPTLARRVRLVA